ncbi:Crp/Fnr family transcriptional regulator [Bradymonas sediminis]|uniref:Crp/Fnr family transcriptional regulator n=1 Tax=Bradymonas sediminis TaxID=1548548 RepID=UPI0010E64BA6|nr:Crp/Fnr family transcriptional regulator [Bradymonas sediminis]TDP73500.1 CRP-like cAMP-binding protein [Bradymonas sediminis]
MATSAKASKSSDKGVKQCPAGTVLFREGEVGTKMYVIKSGRVRLSKKIQDSSIVLEELGAGGFCGEVAMVSDQPRPVTATVVSDAAVIQIDAGQFENMLRSNSDIAVRMMKRMTQRLTRAQFRLANFSLRTTKARLMHQLRNEALNRSTDGGLQATVPIPDDIAASLGLEIGELKKILTALVKDELIVVDARGYFQIIDVEAFDRFLRFLELHDRFEYDS